MNPMYDTLKEMYINDLITKEALWNATKAPFYWITEEQYKEILKAKE